MTDADKLTVVAYTSDPKSVVSKLVSPRQEMFLIWIVIIFISVLFVSLRLDLRDNYINIDELIPVMVSHSMRELGNIDAKWALARDLPLNFRYDQYNFYSYNLVAHTILMVFGPSLPFIKLKFANVIFQAVATWMLCTTAKRNLGACSATMLFMMMAVMPCFVQDAHMARPESFLYLLIAGIVFSVDRIEGRILYVVVGLLIGISIAPKITSILLLLIVAPALYNGFCSSKNLFFCNALILLGALSIGVAVGAPYAIVNPQSYLHGIRHLNTQYSSFHPPHSEPHFHIVANLVRITTFFFMVYGPVIALGFLTDFSKAPQWTLGIFLMSIVTAIFFVGKPVFFERNLSSAILGMAIAGFYALDRRMSYFILSLSILVMTYWSFQIDRASLWPAQRLTKWQIRNAVSPTSVWPWNNPTQAAQTCNGIVGIRDYGDGYSKLVATEFANSGAQIVKRYVSVFHYLPTSTLQTYLDFDVNYYLCRNDESAP